MAQSLVLIPADTKMESNGDGVSFDISASPTRTFLCLLTVADQMEQESLDVSIYGSADGTTWTPKPLLRLPQQFYRGRTKMVLDLSHRSDIKFIRARWEVNRWGRGAPLPMFVAGLEVSEVPAMSSTTQAKEAATAIG